MASLCHHARLAHRRRPAVRSDRPACSSSELGSRWRCGRRSLSTRSTCASVLSLSSLMRCPSTTLNTKPPGLWPGRLAFGGAHIVIANGDNSGGGEAQRLRLQRHHRDNTNRIGVGVIKRRCVIPDARQRNTDTDKDPCLRRGWCQGHTPKLNTVTKTIARCRSQEFLIRTDTAVRHACHETQALVLLIY